MDISNPATWLIGGGTVLGLLAAFWRQSKNLFWQAINLVFCSVKFVGPPTTQVAVFLAEEGKEFPVSIRTVGSKQYFLQSQNRNRTALCDLVPETGKLVYWRGVFVYITRSNSDTYGSASVDVDGNNSKRSTLCCTVTFLRGTIKIVDFLREYEAWLNEQETEKRFTIHHFYGSTNYGGRYADTSIGGPSAVPTETAGSPTSGDGKLIFEQDYLKENAQKVMDILWLAPSVVALVNEVKHWKSSKEWYLERQIPWKRGYLLTGQPGTGKSSLVRALGEELDVPIFVIHMGGMAPSTLKTIWSTASKETPCIILLEDFDNVYNGREPLDHDVPFDTLLNLLDGVDRTDGILTFITTNHPDKLDPALAGGGKVTRPGRIDLVVEMPVLDVYGREKIAKRILPESLIAQAVAEGEDDTGAQFQNRCIVMALENHFKAVPNEQQ